MQKKTHWRFRSIELNISNIEEPKSGTKGPDWTLFLAAQELTMARLSKMSCMKSMTGKVFCLKINLIKCVIQFGTDYLLTGCHACKVLTNQTTPLKVNSLTITNLILQFC